MTNQPASTSAPEQDAENGSAARKKLVFRNVSVNLVSKVFYLVTRFCLPPLTLSYVTLEEYGLWATCFILIGYLGMSAFGVSNVYVRYVAEYHAKGEHDKINQLLSTGLTVISALCTLLLIVLWFLLPMLIVWFKVPAPLQGKAFTLLFVTAATFMLDLSLGAFAYVLLGLQEFTEQTIVWVISFCLEAVLIVSLLMSGYGIYALLWAFVIRYAFATAAFVVLCYRALPRLSLSLRYFDRSMLRLFFSYGAIVQVSGLLGMFLYSIEKLLAGIFIGVHATGLLDVGEKLPMMASQVPASMNGVFLPAMANMQSLDKREEVAELYLKGARYLNMLMGAILGFLAAFALPVLLVWIGTNSMYQTAAVILTLFCLPYQMNELTGPASAFHRSTGQPARELVYSLTQLTLVALTVSVGFWLLGKTVLVICAAVALSMVLSALIYQAYTNHYVGVANRYYARFVLWPGLLTYFVGALCAALLRPALAWAGTGRWQVLAVLALAGMTYVTLTVLALYWGACVQHEREYLRKHIFTRVEKLNYFLAKPA